LPLALLAALAAAGCSGHNRMKDDPLVGNGKALKQDPTTTKAKSPVPAAPETASAGSTAALASGDPLTGGRLLGINDQKAQGDGAGWRGVGPDPQPAVRAAADAGGVRQAAGSVTLRHPEPIVEPVPQVQAVPAAQGPAGPTVVPANLIHPAAAPGQGGALDQLQLELKVRSVTFQREEVTAGGVRLVCGVPSRYNPENLHIYEAEAADPLTARRLIIDQIDRQQGQR
jgi:hypothetical protein